MSAGSRLGMSGPQSPQLWKRGGETDPIRLRAKASDADTVLHLLTGFIAGQGAIWFASEKNGVMR